MVSCGEGEGRGQLGVRFEEVARLFRGSQLGREGSQGL